MPKRFEELETGDTFAWKIESEDYQSLTGDI